jgi:hypothetical protein
MALAVMRRLLAASFAFAFVLAAGLTQPISRAQGLPSATLSLLAQSAWNSVEQPIDIRVRATNDSAVELGSLTLVLSIWAPARSRSVYETSLESDATTTLFAYSFAQGGALQPGASRNFRIRQSLNSVGSRAESAIYPLRIDLLSDITPVATLRTPMIFLNDPPQEPLNMTWTWVLSEPLQYGPDGMFVPGSIEEDIAPGGRLDAIVQAIGLAGGGAMDLVMSAALADQLTRMAAGYQIKEADGSIRTVEKGAGGSADAARILESVSALVKHLSVELVATPYGDANVPSIFQAGLNADFTTLLERGHAAVTSALGTAPRTDIFRPPYTQLDGPSVSRLGARGVSLVLMDANFLPPPAGTRFSPRSVARLVGKHEVSAVVPDDGAMNAMVTHGDDPRLAAHAALGELAADWLEFPGTPGRGVALLFPETTAFSPSFLRNFVRLIVSSPWLRPVTATTLVAIEDAPEAREAIPPQSFPQFGPDYVNGLKAAKASLSQFRLAAPGATELSDRLGEDLLLAEGGAFVTDPSLGERFVAATENAIHDTYAQVRIAGSVLTLASRGGLIPITIANDSGYQLSVLLRLVTDRRLAFSNGNSQVVQLPEGKTTFTFPVRAETTGRILFKVQVLTPVTAAPPRTITELEMVVRSTGYNQVALFITVGAGVFLLAWWGRRFLPRRKH